MYDFEPYYHWLSIPPQEQPPNHYRLLGLALFEPDPQVVHNAADARMGHVRTFQIGPHSQLSQRILNEISAARVCLVNPQKKAEYDAALQASLWGAASIPGVEPPSLPALTTGARARFVGWVERSKEPPSPTTSRAIRKRWALIGVVVVAVTALTLLAGLARWPKEEPGPQLPVAAAPVEARSVAQSARLDDLVPEKPVADHLNHGVSVFNGDCPNFRSTGHRPKVGLGLSPSGWRNYDLLTGPLGERVFSIKTCPLDGDVWIATCAGLTRYRLDDDSWSYYTRAEGLPSDDVQCLAFDKKGTLYAGTQCDGLAICTPTRVDQRLEYTKWRVVTASSALQDRPPVAAFGEGLPSNLANDVLVARDGAVYVATTAGLAASRDNGRTWRFLRGADWEEKARGLCEPPPKEFLKAACDAAQGRTLLLEDYITCLAEDEAGNLWLGHRTKGFETLDPRSGRRLAGDGHPPDATDYLMHLLPDANGFAAGTYSAGLARIPGVTPSHTHRPSDRATHRGLSQFLWSKNGTVPLDPAAEPAAKLPSPAESSPTIAVRDGSHKTGGTALRLSHPTTSPVVAVLPDDWRTEGDWLGRYGRHWACCCAICSPDDYLWGAGEAPLQYDARIGPHCTDDDALRYWIHWLYTDSRKTLEMPPTYHHSRVIKGLTDGKHPRRQAEWDDHGEAYPMSHEGPDVYCTLAVPKGLFFLSLYDMNKDGHGGANRWRDYRVSIRPHDPKAPRENIDGFEQQPELAHARIHDF